MRKPTFLAALSLSLLLLPAAASAQTPPPCPGPGGSTVGDCTNSAPKIYTDAPPTTVTGTYTKRRQRQCLGQRQ